MRTVLILVLALVAAPLQAADKPEALLARMKAWLEPGAPVTRRLAMTVRSGAETTTWTAGQARAPIDGGRAALTVLLEPKELRGTALLVREQTGKPIEQWLYVPYLRRVRKVLPVDEFDSFLNTEFTFADLGFVPLGGRKVTALPPPKDPPGAAQIQEMPKDADTFSRIVTTLVPASGQPLKREFYDVANRLWLVETFEDVAAIHDVPMAQRVRIEDVQSGFGSEYRAADIAVGLPLPQDLFDPAQLSKAADRWQW